MLRFWIAGLVLIGAALAGLRELGGRGEISIVVEPREVPADGYSEVMVTVHSEEPSELSASGRVARIGKLHQTGENIWRAVIRAGTAPGEVRLVASSGEIKTEATVVFLSYDVDREENGMPDAVELDSEHDQEAFRRWFTFLAEAQFFQRPEARPDEINDCAALIRYAYREALKSHDAGWAREAKLPLVRALPSVEKYDYPHTLLGARLFRVKGGAFDSKDAEAFAQFADAQTLQRFNARLVARDVARAQPGDLLFYRHDAADLPFHGMIYLGESQVQIAPAQRLVSSGEQFLVYHTGPDGGDPGEIRRPTMNELLRHPNPAWRPLPGNPAFLGVFRWNILH